MLTRILFAIGGLPIIFTQFLNVVDVLPYSQNMDLIANGIVYEISSEQKANIQKELVTFLEEAVQVPAYAVTFPEMFEEMVKDGYYLSFNFDTVIEINGMPFDQLVFEVFEDCSGFNVFRGNNGVFQGRCFYVNTEKSSSDLYKVVQDIALDVKKNVLEGKYKLAK